MDTQSDRIGNLLLLEITILRSGYKIAQSKLCKKYDYKKKL